MTSAGIRQSQSIFGIETTGQGLYPVTSRVEECIRDSGIRIGQVTIFCRHTSASLVIQEAADPDVLRDLGEYFARLVPEGMDWLRHTSEGPDDMPAHIKGALTDVSIVVPVADSAPLLGTWQGIFLFEHRARPRRREIVVHVLGEE